MERVLLGAVVAAHGIKGEVKVKTFTEAPENLDAYGALTTEDGRRFDIVALRTTKGDEALVHFAGIADRSAAESLKGQGLYVPRSALPAPGDGDYYHTDLIGLRAESPDGAAVGTVAAIHNFGAGTVLEVALAGGGSEFVSFNDAGVPLVDIAGDRVTVVLPRDEKEA